MHTILTLMTVILSGVCDVNVQLPGFHGANEWLRSRSQHWPELREAQLEGLKLSNTGMAVAIDQGHYNDIHLQVKKEIGRRLA